MKAFEMATLNKTILFHAWPVSLIQDKCTCGYSMLHIN